MRNDAGLGEGATAARAAAAQRHRGHRARAAAAADADAPIRRVHAAPVDLDVLEAHVPRRSPFDRHARATGRIVFGASLIVGACVLVADVLTHRRANAVMTLAITWIAAFAAGGLAMLFSHGRARNPDHGDNHAVSFVVPAIGVALLLPISLHAVFMGVAGWLDEFDQWVRLSIVVTGAAHTVFAVMVARRARALATGVEAVSVSRILATTVIVSAIPFALLLMIPPVLVALTGLAIVPLLERMPAWIHRELAVASVPTAIAHYKETAHV